MKLLLIASLLLVSSICYGITIKATGTARARIVAPQEIEVQNQPITIVYTEIGATAQVVF